MVTDSNGNFNPADLDSFELKVCTAPRRQCADWEPSTRTVGKLRGMLANPAVRELKDGPLTFYGALNGPARKRANVAGRTAVVLDIDNDCPSLDILRAGLVMAGVFGFVHTTHSSEPHHLKARVIVPTSRPMTPAEHGGITRALAEKLGVAGVLDKGSYDDERAYYDPARRGEAPYEWCESAGELLNPDAEPWATAATAATTGATEALGSTPAAAEALEALEGRQFKATKADRQLAAQKLDEQEKRLTKLWDDGWDGEPWDNTCFEVACRLVEIGRATELGEDDERFTLEALREWFLANAPQDEGFDLERLEQKWDSALKTELEPFRTLGRTFADVPPPPATEVGEGGTPPAQEVSDGWAPVDLSALLDGDYEPRRPTLMLRTDGAGLLYPGLTHSVQGESGSGKSLLVQWQVAETLKAGGRVLYLDYESSAAEVVRGRLMGAFGCTRDEIVDGLEYVRPDDAPRGAGFERLLETPWDLVVIDGVTEALNTAGLRGDSLTNNNDAVTQWNRMLPSRLAERTGAAVVLIDHVTKSRDNRDYAIGGQAKRAALTGAGYTLEVTKPFSRGTSGELRLYLTKDREGAVDATAEPGKGRLAAIVEVRSLDGGRVELTLMPPSVGDFLGVPDDGLTPKEREALGVLREHPSSLFGPMPKGDWLDLISGTKRVRQDAANGLVEKGYVIVHEDGPKKLCSVAEPLPTAERPELAGEALATVTPLPTAREPEPWGSTPAGCGEG